MTDTSSSGIRYIGFYNLDISGEEIVVLFRLFYSELFEGKRFPVHRLHFLAQGKDVPDAGFEQRYLERFDDIVVCAGIQPSSICDIIDLAVSRITGIWQ